MRGPDHKSGRDIGTVESARCDAVHGKPRVSSARVMRAYVIMCDTQVRCVTARLCCAQLEQ